MQNEVRPGKTPPHPHTPALRNAVRTVSVWQQNIRCPQTATRVQPQPALISTDQKKTKLKSLPPPPRDPHTPGPPPHPAVPSSRSVIRRHQSLQYTTRLSRRYLGNSRRNSLSLLQQNIDHRPAVHWRLPHPTPTPPHHDLCCCCCWLTFLLMA